MSDPNEEDTLSLTISPATLGKSESQTLLVKVLSTKHINSKVLKDALPIIWNTHNQMEVNALAPNIVSCTFFNRNDRDRIL